MHFHETQCLEKLIDWLSCLKLLSFGIIVIVNISVTGRLWDSVRVAKILLGGKKYVRKNREEKI